MQRLSRQFEFARVARRQSVFAKIEIQPFVVPVKFVADDAVSDVLRVNADLMFASRVQFDAGERVAVPAKKRLEKSYRRARIGTVADALFHEHGARRIRTQRRVHKLRRREFAFENRHVSFGNLPSLDRLLAFARRFAIERDENDAARLAIEPRNKMHRRAAALFPHGADETRPRTVF